MNYPELAEKYRKHPAFSPKAAPWPDAPFSIFGLPVYFEAAEGASLIFVSRDTDWPRVFSIHHLLKARVWEKNKVIEDRPIHPLELPGIDYSLYVDRGIVKLNLGNHNWTSTPSGWKKDAPV